MMVHAAMEPVLKRMLIETMAHETSPAWFGRKSAGRYLADRALYVGRPHQGVRIVVVGGPSGSTCTRDRRLECMNENNQTTHVTA